MGPWGAWYESAGEGRGTCMGRTWAWSRPGWKKKASVSFFCFLMQRYNLNTRMTATSDCFYLTFTKNNMCIYFPSGIFRVKVE